MDSLQTISSDLVNSITEKEKKKSIPYDTYAKVIRIDGGTAWVHIPGGVDETPVALTVNAKVGDSVLVRVSGGNAWIVGNSSAPPTDDTKAVEAKDVADVAQVKAASAQETAETAEATAASARARASSALEIAEGTNEHFWHDNTGAHITQITQEEWQDTPAGGNTLITSEGMAIRDGMTSLAVFGADGARLGQSGFWHIEIDSVSFGLFNPLNVEYAHIGAPVGGIIIDVFGYPRRGDGINYVLAQTPNNTPVVKKNGVTLTEGTDYTLSGNNLTMTSALGAADEVTVEYTTGASVLFTSFGERIGGPGDDSFVEGHQNIASGYTSHAEGRRTLASGQASHAEGELSSATGSGAHAEGNGQASGTYSHAEGSHAEATNNGAHAEGFHSTASGAYSHAEGERAVASGADSHAQNEETVAAKKAQTAIGTYNEQDTATTTTHPSGTAAYGEHAVIIGNGEDDNSRSNALTVDWNGNVEASGDITDGSGNVLADKLDVSGVLNIFYPVGSYYETSDTTFNPNTAWGGRWVLETAGKFHVSAGTGYTAGSAGGSADAIVPYHRHSVAKVTAGITGGAHTHDIANRSVYGGSSNYMALYKGGTGTSTNAALSETHTHDLPAHNTDYAGTSGNTTGANMPPYIAVNRWHRTA